MKNSVIGLIGLFLIGSYSLLLLSCENWELPGRKSQRVCVKPSGNLDAQIQQLKVDFSISSNTGTIDKVIWDFGNGSTTATTGLTVSYTYPASNTYTVKATLTNSCGVETTLLRTISVSNAVSPTVTLQPATDVSTTSATLLMTITANGNSTISRYGICYSATNPQPDITKDNVSEKPIPPTLNTPISFSLTSLLPNTLYYVRSFALNQAVTTPGVSSVQTFRTGQDPVITNNGSTNVGASTATVNFIVTSAGSPAAVEYGICYSSSVSTPDVSNASIAPVTGPAIGTNVAVSLSNLTPNKTYYYRPYAKPPSGLPVYGAVMSFTTQIDPVAQDLIASVAFTDKSLLDVSGYNNHVTLIGNPAFTTDRKGKANSAILLDGVDDYFYMAENSSLNPDALSVSIWIKPIAMNGRMQIYNKSRFTDSAFEVYSALMKLENDVGPNISIITDIKQNSGCVSGKGWQDFQFTSSIPLNNWHHLVFTYTGRSVRMYFDNALLYTKDDLPASAMDKCPGGDLKFGGQYQGLPWYFYGAMDDIRIYKRALTASEVQTLFNQ